jgi:hypothetical protein
LARRQREREGGAAHQHTDGGRGAQRDLTGKGGRGVADGGRRAA